MARKKKEVVEQTEQVEVVEQVEEAVATESEKEVVQPKKRGRKKKTVQVTEKSAAKTKATTSAEWLANVPKNKNPLKHLLSELGIEVEASDLMRKYGFQTEDSLCVFLLRKYKVVSI